MKKILFLIRNFEAGGAERILVELLKNLPKDRFSPILVVYEKKGPFLKFIPENIPIFELGSKHLKLPLSILSAVFKLASIIKSTKPNLILAFLQLSIFLSFFGRKLSGIDVPLWAGERGPACSYFAGEPIGVIKKLLYRFIFFFCYPRIEGVLACSFGIKRLLEKNIPKIPKIEVIQNGYSQDRILKLSEEPVNHVWIKENRDYYIVVCVGRVVWAKNYSLCIKVLSKLRQEGMDVRCLIIGKEDASICELKILKKLIKELNLVDYVDFLGFQDNPWKYVAKSDVFILSSRYEGFPNVLVEAMLCGIPPVAVDCISGPNEIIEDGKSGFLVKDGDELKDKLELLLKDRSLREKLGMCAKERAKQFSLDKMLSKYISFFSEYS